MVKLISFGIACFIGFYSLGTTTAYGVVIRPFLERFSCIDDCPADCSAGIGFCNERCAGCGEMLIEVVRQVRKSSHANLPNFEAYIRTIQKVR